MRRQHILVALWLLGDAALFIGTYATAYVLRVGWILSTDFPLGRLLAVITAISPLWLLVLAAFGAFHPLRNQRTFAAFAHVCTAALLGVALFTLGYYFRFTAFFSRLLLLEAFILSSVIPWAWHAIMQGIIRRALRASPPSFPTLIIGATRETVRLLRALRERKSPLAPVAILDAQGTKEDTLEGVPVCGKLNRLEEILTEKRVTHLIQCSNIEHTANLLGACRARGVTYMLLPSVLGIVERDERIESLEGFPVTVVRPHRQWWTRLFE